MDGSMHGQRDRASRRELSATGRRDRGRRSSSSTATWSTGDSGTASSTRSPTASAASPRTGRWARSRWRWSPTPTSPLPGSRRSSKSFLEALDLDDVTLVGNDSGGAHVPGARRPPPRPGRPARPHQLRHPRELPARDLQGAAAAGEAARRRDAAGPPLPDPGRHPDRLPSLRQEKPPPPGWSSRGRGPAPPTRRSGATSARSPAAWTSATPWPPRRALTRLRLPPPPRLGSRRPLLPDPLRRTPGRAKSAARNWSAYPIRRPSYRSISPPLGEAIADFAPSP